MNTYIDIDDILSRQDIKFIHDGIVYEIVGLGTEGLRDLRDKSIMIKLDLHLRRVDVDED